MISTLFLLSVLGSQGAEGFRIKEGFKVEKVHDVTAAGQGSWVCMTFNPAGRNPRDGEFLVG